MNFDFDVVAICLALLLGAVVGAAFLRRRMLVGLLKPALSYLESTKTSIKEKAQPVLDDDDGNVKIPKDKATNDVLIASRRASRTR